MNHRDIAIRLARKFYRVALRRHYLNPSCDMDRATANHKIRNLLSSNKPCMISRFGTTELNCINNYLCIKSNDNILAKLSKYVVDNTHTPWWNRDHFETMSICAGLFPPSEDTSTRFSQRYLADIPLIDLLGSFQYYEKFMPLRSDVQRVQLETLYPFFVEEPWTTSLKGKRVLVVHPFDYSIRSQYEKRHLLFSNPDVLPDYELITFRAVQSVAGSPVQFKDWFEALAYMEAKIAGIEFDVCILGCGAYGLPLAAHVKRLGKKAIHIGGGTQLLFGIKGKRWTEQYQREWVYRPNETIQTNYSDMFNEHWVFPDASERPANSAKVENSCYW